MPSPLPCQRFARLVSGGSRRWHGRGLGMSYFPIFECGLLGFGIVLVVIPLLLKACQRGMLVQRAVDLHHTNKAEVPRLGGVALAAAFVGVELFILTLYPDNRLRIQGRLVIVVSSLAMFVLGFWDDLRPLGAKRKLLGQVLISLVVVVSSLAMFVL